MSVCMGVKMCVCLHVCIDIDGNIYVRVCVTGSAYWGILSRHGDLRASHKILNSERIHYIVQ